jgi:hypothetical protein
MMVGSNDDDAELGSATSDRDDWEGSTPTDAGEALFGPMDTDDT